MNNWEFINACALLLHHSFPFVWVNFYQSTKKKSTFMVTITTPWKGDAAMMTWDLHFLLWIDSKWTVQLKKKQQQYRNDQQSIKKKKVLSSQSMAVLPLKIYISPPHIDFIYPLYSWQLMKLMPRGVEHTSFIYSTSNSLKT